MQETARGTFEVKLSPQPPAEGAGDPALNRMALDKTFSGDLQGTSRGQMLAYRSDVEGSAGYVALERVEGGLAGRRGSFVLQHFGVMDRGAPELTVRVVPDSGTGELAGLQGTMTIEIEGGTHRYGFTYSLPQP